MGSAYNRVIETRKELTKQLLAEMEQGELPWMKGWKTTGTRPCDTPTRVLANGRGFLRHGRTPQRAITSPLHPVTSLPLSRLFCGCLF